MSLQQVKSFDIQAWMEKEYLQHQSKKLLKDQIKSSDKGLDLHTTSINQARQQSTVAIHQAIEKIINDFRSNKSTCALSYDDSAVLLARNPKFKRYLNWIKDTNPDFQYKIDTSTFGAACVRYLNCSNQNDKKSNNISTSEYQICVNDISRKFVSYMDNFLSNDAIGNFNYGDEIFENGTLEDSSFDIMYDIEQINKILLANPKVIPSYYLRGPPNYLSIQNSKFKIQNGANVIVNGKLGTEKGSLLAFSPYRLFASNGNTSLPNIDDAISQIQNSEESDSNIVSNLQCFDPQPILETEEVQDFVEQIAQIENTVFNLEEKNLLDNAIGTVMQPFYEEPPQPTAQGFPIEIFKSITNDPNETTTSTNGTTGNNGNTGNSNTVEEGNTEEETLCPTTTADIASQFDLQSDKPKVIECLNSCNECEAGFFAKKICYTQCLCSKFANEEEFLGGLGGTTFGAKLCLVPSTTPDMITPGSQVVSIQEIVNQISATVSKLKESGQYIPSSKPSEFFSPTVKVGQLTNLLNFTVNVMFKTKYRKTDKNIETEKTENYFDTQTPNQAQLQIQNIVGQQDRYSDFLKIHMDFWSRMNSTFDDRNKSMKQFNKTQN